MVWTALARIWRLQRAPGGDRARAGPARVERLFPLAPPGGPAASLPHGGRPGHGPARAHGEPDAKRLEAQGFLRRSLDPEDLRRYRLELTPKGEKALAQAEGLLEAALARRLARLTPEEQALLVELLARLEEP